MRLTGAERAHATHSQGTGGATNSDGGAMHVDLVNAGTQRTFLVGTVGGNPPMVVFNGSGPFSIGQADAIQGITRSNTGFAAGVQGRNQASSGQSVGVFGTTSSTSGTGIFGTSGLLGGAIPVQAAGAGVFGNGGQSGVFGQSQSGIGVEGDSSNSTGVIGRATAPGNPNPGVIGSATSGYGVFGFSANSNGIAGQSGGGAAGCAGFASAPGGYGIYGGTAVAGGYAGGFGGPVLVVGDFTATGGAKSAAVPHPDGTHRRLYCMESPESLFEDFGEARLVGGRAEVKLDPDYGAVVHNDKYFVYLTPRGDSKGLYVSSQTPSGFEVREQQGGASNLDFNYRVVARRKDIPGPRLEKGEAAQPIKELLKPDVPKPSEPPKAPRVPELPAQ